MFTSADNYHVGVDEGGVEILLGRGGSWGGS